MFEIEVTEHKRWLTFQMGRWSLTFLVSLSKASPVICTNNETWAGPGFTRRNDESSDAD